ncbi:uncharacterized protein JCM15063_001322 [Sporobolomyces koalae]|uniref:uncharacterized protein n=1 Tax=Sporobolomyces koalae TaxID=500713 RepID=UPI0031776AC3
MASSKEASNTIYVGGFSSETTAAAIHAAFQPFGEILDLQVPPDPTSKHRHRGFAFVSYAQGQSALDAIDNMHRNVLPGVTNQGKALKVNRAKPQKGAQNGNSNKPVWANEEWLQEHGVAPVQTENGKDLPPP